MATDPSGFPPLPGSSILGAIPLSLPPVTYASNLSASPSYSDEFPMSFVSPAKKLSFKTDDLSEGKSFWNLSLVGYSIGQRPYYERLLAAMNKAWKLKGSFSLLSLADDFFLIKFTSAEDFDLVRTGGPWFLLGKPFILQQWSPKFKPKRDESGTLPLWIKVLDLPLALWTPTGISKIASYIGVPLYVDSLTAKRTRLTFARICVQIDRNSELPDEIPMDIDGEDFNLKVVYDWKPTRCEGCGSLIHPFALCPSNPTPKPAIPPRPPFRGRSNSRKPTGRSNSQLTGSAPVVPPSLPPSLPPQEVPLISDSIPSVPLPSNNIPDNNVLSVVVNATTLPNLNLPNEESSSSDQQLVGNISSSPGIPKSLIPPQVLIANSFASLLAGDQVLEEDDNIEEEGSLSSLPSNPPPPSTSPKASPSSTKATTSKNPSPAKKPKGKTAKKAKSNR
ncbi:uncharacterized protein LOC110097546 [Dendrobium catenatum]|uniref:uncharacterized protein LOC110097546 n=1 Tax=Dendrobium catenatum TaxID=906689 RepID=UPI0009F5B4EC|nr:uncharacterized protein LOC110097546 [Dendrobium catenatum]